MIIDLTIPLKIKIDASKIQSIHDSLVTIRDAAAGTDKDKEELNAIIEPIAQKLQYLKDRKFLIQDAKDMEMERIRLIRSGLSEVKLE